MELRTAAEQFSAIHFPTDDRAVAVTIAAAQSSRALLRAFADNIFQADGKSDPAQRPIPKQVAGRVVRARNPASSNKGKTGFLGATDLASHYGFTPRYWVRLAAEGKIPGAHQPSGAQGHWLFDPVTFKRWWATTQRKVLTWPGYTAEGRSIGSAPNVKVENTREASKQRIGQLLNDVLGSGSMTSTQSPGGKSRGGRSRRRRKNSSAST